MGIAPGEHTARGTMRLRRVGRFGFPVDELVDDHGTLAQLGRDGTLRIFFGPGRRVHLTDGIEWRIKATTSGRYIVPIVRSAEGVVAVSGPLPAKRTYGVNGHDWAYVLMPTGHIGVRRPGKWVLRRHETDVADIDDRLRVVHASAPVPVAAILVAFTLIKHGIPGEASLMPKRD